MYEDFFTLIQSLQYYESVLELCEKYGKFLFLTYVLIPKKVIKHKLSSECLSPAVFQHRGHCKWLMACRRLDVA